ncbi:putative S-adenosyl-L-methionine-dependent methyltransferase MAV_5150 [uncultured Mycobacterium sp.]|uniref:S-adenosyl-L-methionine-dependent methyltransferase n=1 Tax=uncultured Mycobacterium sp. TaxID=171292 RepID=A0A1Y5PDE9_9MYCO|nr:putative S-adenosyl-L-methionine-dependent methyltransferase MAV_5150 [uncultured Mycobacterium sp.]
MSWDITTDLGSTALAVAAQRAAETAQDNPLIHDEFAAVLVAAAQDPGWLTIASGDTSWLGADNDIGQRAAQAGREYVATRTVFFDEFCAKAAGLGIDQFVILAAGLDARAYRLPALTGRRVYEIDQPAVQAFKDAALTAHGATPLADLTPVSVDLRDQRWPLMLADAGWDHSVPTAWLVEGLLPYLTSAEHDALFDLLTALSPPDSRIAAEVYHHATTHLGDKRLSTWRNGAADIDDALGVDVDVTAFIKDTDTSDTAAWLTQHGWSVKTLDSRDEMSRLGRPIPPDLSDIAPASSLVTAIRHP